MKQAIVLVLVALLLTGCTPARVQSPTATPEPTPTLTPTIPPTATPTATPTAVPTVTPLLTATPNLPAAYLSAVRPILLDALKLSNEEAAWVREHSSLAEQLADKDALQQFNERIPALGDRLALLTVPAEVKDFHAGLIAALDGLHAANLRLLASLESASSSAWSEASLAVVKSFHAINTVATDYTTLVNRYK